MKPETTLSASTRPNPLHGTVVPPRRISSVELLRTEHELEIQHGADVYRLRRTSNDKLILTK